jgi:DNA topoisomerase-1
VTGRAVAAGGAAKGAEKVQRPAQNPAVRRRARLVFTHDRMPGYARRRRGKGFSYLLPGGELPSLLDRHIGESDQGWVLRFRGKSGKLHRADIGDPNVSALVEELQEIPSQHLFSYYDQGRWRPVRSSDVNGWLKEIGGEGTSTKQFRAWRATVLCARALAAEPPPGSKAARARARNQAVRQTAEQLNQTPAICRKYYIHPAVFRAWRAGVLFERMNSRAPRLRKSDDSANLRADERRVLSLIDAFAPRRERPRRG